MAKKQDEIIKATHQGEMIIGASVLPVAVLANRERVVSIRGMATALGVKGGGSYWKEKRTNPDKEMLPEFISAKNIEPYVQEKMAEIMNGTVPYISTNGFEAVGIRAEIIPKICDIWIKALSDGNLTEKQRKVAEQSRILLGAFAEVGITALIDEATGFQKEKDEYQKILAKYIANELQPWLKTFGEDYYYQLYRLKGWDWNKYAVDRKNHPWAVANITNRIIYEKLPEGVLGALDDLTSKNKSGNRVARLHQGLTAEDGRTHLLKHLGAVENLMEQFGDGEWELALQAIDARFPSKRLGAQLSMDLNFHEGDKRVFDSTLSRAVKSAEGAEEKEG